MSTDEEIADLKGRLRAAEELLFLVLDEVGEPVVLDIAESRTKMRADRIIDIQLNDEQTTWTLEVVNVASEY